MKVIDTFFSDVKIIEPTLYKDERGFFYESYNEREFNKIIERDVTFVQDNRSLSTKNTIRGLHFQPKKPQAKLIQVLSGKIYDVTVDLRAASPTKGQWFGRILEAEENISLWIPEGFAHGFLALSDNTEILYKASDYYDPENQGTLLWNDPVLSIDWPLIGEPIVSKKDKEGLFFSEIIFM